MLKVKNQLKLNPTANNNVKKHLIVIENQILQQTDQSLSEMGGPDISPFSIHKIDSDKGFSPGTNLGAVP